LILWYVEASSSPKITIFFLVKLSIVQPGVQKLLSSA
jgi:hypothetical protein